MRIRHLIFALMGAAAVTGTAHAQDSAHTFSVQGVLRNSMGQLQSMMLTVTVNLWDAQTAGTLIKTYSPQTVMAQNGLFTVNLFESNSTILYGKSQVWTELDIQGIGTFPRQLVTSSIYAWQLGLPFLQRSTLNGGNAFQIDNFGSATGGSFFSSGSDALIGNSASNTSAGVLGFNGSGGVAVHGRVNAAGTGVRGDSGLGLAGDFHGPVSIATNGRNTGNLTFSGGTSHTVDFGATGVAPPSNTSDGWKIKLFNGVPVGFQNYGLGIDAGTLWYSAGGTHRWFTTDGTNYTPQMLLTNFGNLTIGGSFFANGAPDLAETIPAAPDVGTGDVVCADPRRAERAVRCRRSDRAVLGVIADGRSGFVINAHGGSPDAKPTGKPLVLAGRVPVRVSLENGPIAIGDPLAPSSMPGVAMRAGGSGPTVGIALAPFDGKGGKTGEVLCFVKVGDYAAAELARENAELRGRVAKLEQAVEAILARRASHKAMHVSR